MSNRVLPVLALFIAIGIFFYYVSPTWTGSIAAMKVAIASDVQALAAASEYSTQKSQLASAEGQIDSANLDRLAAFLPASVDNVQLILDLNALAARSGVSISHADITTHSANDTEESSESSTTNTGPISSVDLSLSSIGTYTALQSFLSGIEKSQRLLDVRDLTVKGSDTGVYTYDMTLRLYWLK
jgi:hypothetical protein